jgi:hypothetical protein
MPIIDHSTLFRIWGADNVAYGPLDLSHLMQWIHTDRIHPDDWVFLEADHGWRKAGEIPELRAAFDSPKQALSPATHAAEKKPRGPALDTSMLLRLKLFAGLEERQLSSFSHYLEVVPCPQFGHIVRKGENGDAMYVVLEGEVRALTIVEGKESTLATITAGECFGEVSLLDQGPRSADIIANKDSVLLKLSSAAFLRLVREAPALAVPFLLALSRAVVGRVRSSTARYEDTIRFLRLSVKPR